MGMYAESLIPEEIKAKIVAALDSVPGEKSQIKYETERGIDGDGAMATTYVGSIKVRTEGAPKIMFKGFTQKEDGTISEWIPKF
jgi:hypothetical protein